MNTILPFRLNNSWFGMDLEKVKGVEICGKISLMPNAELPLAGLMQKFGTIYPIWSLYALVQEKPTKLHESPCYMELLIKEKSILIPVDEILSVTTVSHGWVPSFKYGLKIYRSLDKKKPQHTEKVDETPIKQRFDSDTNISGYNIEEI
jgi:hypothetical protein